MSANNTTALNATIVENAKGVIDAYINDATTQYQSLKTVIETLTSTEFTGDAAEGYKNFFVNKITPALTTNLTDPGNSLTATLKSMLDSIKTSLLDTVDPQLKSQNEQV